MPELFNQISRYNKIRMGCHQFTARTYGPILNIIGTSINRHQKKALKFSHKLAEIFHKII